MTVFITPTKPEFYVIKKNIQYVDFMCYRYSTRNFTKELLLDPRISRSHNLQLYCESVLSGIAISETSQILTSNIKKHPNSNKYSYHIKYLTYLGLKCVVCLQCSALLNIDLLFLTFL